MKEEIFKDEMKAFNIEVDDIEHNEHIFRAIEKTIHKMKNEYLVHRVEVVLNNNLIETRDKLTNYRTILGCRVSYDDLPKDVSFIVRPDDKPSYEILEQENKSLQSQLKAKEEMVKIMEKYFELIIDLGFDYDGFNKADSLKSLIDTLVRFAKLGRACNTTEPIYLNNDKKYNILNEAIEFDVLKALNEDLDDDVEMSNI